MADEQGQSGTGSGPAGLWRWWTGELAAVFLREPARPSAVLRWDQRRGLLTDADGRPPRGDATTAVILVPDPARPPEGLAEAGAALGLLDYDLRAEARGGAPVRMRPGALDGILAVGALVAVLAALVGP
ncbi:MAG: hypothetical protein HXY25_01445, partial [Alphaproteobacteria bacterium]|nr:hypothetical protein [Alphaproteobacteria bacterium]